GGGWAAGPRASLLTGAESLPGEAPARVALSCPLARRIEAGSAAFLRGAAGAVIFAAMSEVTRILSAIEGGDPSAAGQLLPLVYDELRKLAAQKLARETPGQTLDATALVHESYLRLVDVDQAQHWNSQGHFF